MSAPGMMVLALLALAPARADAQEHAHAREQAAEPASHHAHAAHDAHAMHGPQQGEHAHDTHDAAAHAGHGAAAAAAGDPPRPPPAHVPPPAPEHEMHEMTHAEMVDVMGMDDRARFGMLAFDRLEHLDAGGQAWEANAWHGSDTNRFVLRSEGERSSEGLEHADLEVLWGRPLAAFWDTRLGMRRDFGHGAGRTWLAFGIDGVAPYWFELSATGYLGEGGRTALRLEAEYEWLLTQRLVLQPRAEVEAYGKSDAEAGIGSGISEAAIGLRLRYELRREFAPYVGVEHARRFGGTADFARDAGEAASGTRWVAGIRVWF